MHIIPTRVHGALDYIVGALLIVAPWLLGFANGGPAQWVPVMLGAAIIIYSLLTAYESGVVPAIPLSAHLGLDVLGGIFLTMSPWLFGFEQLVVWPHVVVGLAEIVIATLTPSYPQSIPVRA
jgi:hypothetical protein